MRKLKFFLLATFVLALLVTGITVTASAQDDNPLSESDVFGHNITLASDFVYNVYVNKNASDVKVNGAAAELKPYNSTHNVIEIDVPVKTLQKISR